MATVPQTPRNEVDLVHAGQLLDLLNQDRQMSRAFCDVTIKAGAQYFPVHKCVLGVYSDHFAELLSSNVEKHGKTTLHLSGISATVFDAILNFIYTGKFISNIGDLVTELLDAVESMKLSKVVHQIANQLSDSLDNNNCVTVWRSAVKFEMKGLMDASLSFITQNLSSIMGSNVFQHLDEDELLCILQNNRADDVDEEMLGRALFSWVNQDLSRRKDCLCKLFSSLKIGELSNSYLSDIAKLELVRSSKDCASRIIDELTERIPGSHEKTIVSHFFAFDDVFIRLVMFNIKQKLWKDFSVRQSARCDAAVVKLKNVIYVIGGVCKNTGKVTNHVEKLNLDNPIEGWRWVTPLSESRQAASATCANGSIYVTGGFGSSRTFLSSAEKYDPEEEEWSFFPEPKVKRAHHVLVAVKNFLFAIAGTNKNGQLRSVECYNTKSRRWKMVAEMMNGQGVIHATEFNDEIYTIESLKPKASFEKYNPCTNVWCSLPSPGTTKQLRVLCSCNGKIYAVGSELGKSASATSVEEFDPITNQWILVTKSEKGFVCSTAMGIG